MMSIPNKSDALVLLQEHVKDPYQILHAKMVAAGLEFYANKSGDDAQLWYTTGLLHDIDYYEFPAEHPQKSLEWFKDWVYPDELIHAVAAHAMSLPRVKPETKLAAALIAVDELAGLIYAYSLMRPTGFEGMEAKSVIKKFKDKAFAAKIDREEIMYGVNEFGVDFKEHVEILIEVYRGMGVTKV